MKDPIVAEVRWCRAEHTKRFKGDPHLICEDLRDFERTLGDRVIQTTPKRRDPATRPAGQQRERSFHAEKEGPEEWGS